MNDKSEPEISTDPDELLFAHAFKGDLLSAVDRDRIVERLVARLSQFFNAELVVEEQDLSDGFWVAWQSVGKSLGPLELRLWGTFGIDGLDGSTPCVQCFAYLYSGTRKLVAVTGENHLHLKYVRASVEDFRHHGMTGLTGPGEWRCSGWSKDPYFEFGDRDIWPGEQPSPGAIY